MMLEMELKKRDQQGIEQGINKKARTVAMDMLKDNMDIALIAKYTKLSIEEIEALAKK